MTDEKYWSLADEFEITDEDGQSKVPAKYVEELAMEVWKNNRSSKNRSRRDESEADMGLFRFKGISSKKVNERIKKLYDELESGNKKCFLKDIKKR